MSPDQLTLEPEAQASESAHCFPRICTAMTSFHPLGNSKARQGGNDHTQFTEEEAEAQEGESGVSCPGSNSPLTLKTAQPLVQRFSNGACGPVLYHQDQVQT